MKKHFLLVVLAALTMLASGCLKLEDQSAKDEKAIMDYIEKEGLVMEKDPSGLYYRIDDEGSGSNPTIYNTVTVNYKGYLLNGSVFDETAGSPVSFPLANLIPGWQIGIPLIKKGGSILLIVPSELGYGTRNTGSIPANSVLVFEIQLVNIK
ncbi:MAG: FKBP-type peptidyl-prolyl cis-trans isomerase [Lewinellaceae bacterium]|nr:FKBP-type peptidyl-prolyl cis-trans isomerase [Lewinellaceae bacterium]